MTPASTEIASNLPPEDTTHDAIENETNTYRLAMKENTAPDETVSCIAALPPVASTPSPGITPKPEGTVELPAAESGDLQNAEINKMIARKTDHWWRSPPLP